jgi:hypothetical protein
MRYRITLKGTDVENVEIADGAGAVPGSLVVELDSTVPLSKDEPDGIIPAIVGALGMDAEFANIVALFSSSKG